jgi:hypothetical protein
MKFQIYLLVLSVFCLARGFNSLTWIKEKGGSWAAACEWNKAATLGHLEKLPYNPGKRAGCAASCAAKVGCTHYLVRPAGCWLKSGIVSEADAYDVTTEIRGENGVVCGIISIYIYLIIFLVF